MLGLNLSIEELQAQEAALEQEFSARFRRAVSATRESLSERLDTVFQGLKQIDENLLDELEEALIAADIGVATTQHILETVRRGVARKQINDLDALKQAIKDELLKILRQSEKQGVASETSVAGKRVAVCDDDRWRKRRGQNYDDRQAGAANQGRRKRCADLRGRHFSRGSF